MPAPDDDEAIVRAAERTVRRILRGQYIGYTRDDLLQEGRIAAWLARGAARVPDEPEHARRYLARRTQGAMLDAVRATRRQLPAERLVEWSAEIDGRAQPAQPDARLLAREVVERLMRRATPRTIECVELLATGADAAAVAAAMRVSAARVSQYRAAARAAIGEHF